MSDHIQIYGAVLTASTFAYAGGRTTAWIGLVAGSAITILGVWIALWFAPTVERVVQDNKNDERILRYND